MDTITKQALRENLYNLLLLIFLNHLITLIVFFHSFTLNLLTNSAFIWSNICSLILAISFLDGFMSLVFDKFFQFDIKDFYLSIKETLLHEVVQFAKEHVRIITKDVEVIFHAQNQFYITTESLG